MRGLVTGGAGFIGSHVVDRLREHGVTPRVFDLVRSPYHPAGEVETFLGSLMDPEALRLAMAGCHAVIHLAAVADVKDVHEDPSYAENVNSRGTLNVLDAARRAGIGRVVYGSTTWVYSDCPDQFVDEDTLIASPSHLYTATKLAGETYCFAYRSLYDVSYTILRFGIPYGPRAREGAVVPIFVRKALAGEPLTVAGDGMQFRKFVYVEDLAQGIVRGLKPIAVDRIYNLDGGEEVSILEIAETVRSAVGGEVEIVHTEARPGDFSGKEVSSERARSELGWEATTPFAEGVERYVEWRRARALGEEESWRTVDPELLV
jgi:UDP-glucose 4-epimerase